ncbi:hypothetical protein ACROYT_G015006 [Oculina patagonica]
MDHPNYRGKRLTSKVKITTMTTMEDSTGKSNEGGNESTGRKTKEKEAVKKSTGNVWSEAAKAAKLERKVMQETCPPVHKGKKGHGGARVTVVEKRRYITSKVWKMISIHHLWGALTVLQCFDLWWKVAEVVFEWIGVFREKTHTNKYADFPSQNPMQHKEAMVKTLLNRANLLPSKPDLKSSEQDRVMEDLRANRYPGVSEQEQNSCSTDIYNVESGDRDTSDMEADNLSKEELLF